MYSDIQCKALWYIVVDYRDNLHFSVSDCKRHGCEYAGAAEEEERIPLKFGG